MENVTFLFRYDDLIVIVTFSDGSHGCPNFNDKEI